MSAQMREGVVEGVAAAGAYYVEALPDSYLDTVAIRVNGPEAWDVTASIDWIVTDVGVGHRTELTNGVLIQRDDPAGDSDLTVTLTKAQLIGLLGGAITLADVETTGDLGIVQSFLDVLAAGQPGVPIVTPPHSARTLTKY